MSLHAGSKLLRDWIDRAAQRDPLKPWLVCADGGRSISYGELRDTTRRIAAVLSERALGRNQRVALLANNSAEHLLCYLGVMAYGATICTVHVEMNRNQLENIFERLKPELVLYQAGLALDDLLARVAAPCLPLGHYRHAEAGSFFGEVARCEPIDRHAGPTAGDDAVILFTSGTSARPKGVVLTFREHLGNIEPTANGFGIGAHDRIYDFRSLNWASAQLLGALVPVSCGATLVLAPKFSASRFFPHVREHRVTVAAGNPTTVNILLNTSLPESPAPLPTLRFLTSSSAPLTLEQWQRFEHQFGTRIAQGYGSSETGWMAVVSGEERRLGTAGRPLPYHRLAIVDAEGHVLASGKVGEVEIGGFDEHEYRYLDEDGSIRVNSRGRLRTGDLGLLDAEGFLVLTGRAKDLIIRGGINISPLEIDSLLMQHPDVVEAATIGIPDSLYGEEVVSFVVTRAGAAADANDVLRYCSDALPVYKAPKQIKVCAALPKTERGKLDRKLLVERWVAGS
ncbi:MAG: class I adenylate-forming enzyme family protein [Xanthobacteraceae bacterium]